MRRSGRIARRIIGLAVLIGMLAALGLPSTAGGQAADPRIDVWLYASVVGIQTASTARPTVRLFDAAGNRRAEVTASGQPAGGRWQVSLTPPGADLGQAVLIQPGDRIEVTLGGQVTRVVVPEMTVRPDDAADRVSGTAPPGTRALYAQLHRDESWFDPPYAIEAIGPVLPGAGGRFDIPLGGKFDLAPGTWGELVAVGADGQLTVFQFAPPALTIHTTEPYAILRATPPERPVLALQSEIGTELFRSAPAFALGGALFAVLMVQDGIPANGIYQPGPDETAVMWVDGQAVLEAPLPRALVTIDDGARTVHGYAPAGARTLIALSPAGSGGPSVNALVAPDADGRFSVAFAGQAVERDAMATVLTYPGQGVARVTTGVVPAQNILLHGYTVSGTLPGWGEVRIEQRAPDGSLRARGSVRADAGGAFDAELITPEGRRTILAPGDRLVFTPELGTVVDLTIPLLTATVDAGKRALQGQAPPGAEITALVYSGDPDYFGLTSYEREYQTIGGRSDPGGAFDLRCAPPAPSCAMRYGYVTARSGSANVILAWLDTPLLGLGVTVGGAIGWATAGLSVQVAAQPAGGAPAAPMTDTARPGEGGRLPGFDTPLDGVFPDGMKPGDRARITIGASGPDVTIPAFDWQANPARDSVAGSGPAGRAVVLVAYARGDTTTRPLAASATVVIGAGGRWQARFDGFDLHGGDDLALYLLGDNHFLWWVETAIQATEPEPTPTRPPPPTSPPTATRTARPTATPTMGPRQAPLYLPSAATWR